MAFSGLLQLLLSVSVVMPDESDLAVGQCLLVQKAVVVAWAAFAARLLAAVLFPPCVHDLASGTTRP